MLGNDGSERHLSAVAPGGEVGPAVGERHTDFDDVGVTFIPGRALPFASWILTSASCVMGIVSQIADMPVLHCMRQNPTQTNHSVLQQYINRFA